MTLGIIIANLKEMLQVVLKELSLINSKSNMINYIYLMFGILGLHLIGGLLSENVYNLQFSSENTLIS